MKYTYIRNGETLRLDAEKCTGCGMCLEVCPHSVFQMQGGKAAITEKDSCMECGACKLNCPAKAIEVKSGVGCAGAVLRGIVTGKEASCGCSDDGKSSSCCG
jgi:NAD-dependent dihydropyrimidine dehydrogenase PreA subunit